MTLETVLLSLCLVLAFGGVPLATLVHAHIATVRAARHVAEIEALAASRPDIQEQPADNIMRLGVLELQALAIATAEELKERSQGRAREKIRPRGDRFRSPPPPLAKAG